MTVPTVITLWGIGIWTAIGVVGWVVAGLLYLRHIEPLPERRYRVRHQPQHHSDSDGEIVPFWRKFLRSDAS